MIPKIDEATGRPDVTLVPQLGPDGAPVELVPRSLLTVEGIYWALSSMVRNFTGLPALGLVFVSMLGIGLAEKFGFFSALMRALALVTPKQFLTPVVVFIGANSSIASDAGYIILPPLAAALYMAVGRSPIAGLAAAFAGVAGGFGGGFFPTAADGFLAGEATRSAHIVDASYATVTALHNWYFKAGSAIVVMLAGWFVTDVLVEPRLLRQSKLDAAAEAAAERSAEREAESMGVSKAEARGLGLALATMAVVLGIFLAMIFVPGWPLHGPGATVLAGPLPIDASLEAHSEAQ
jgi:aminobenzoyl-glutamate transport protein